MTAPSHGDVKAHAAVRTESVPWRVLLIGGSSGAGKTVVAQELGQSLGISVLLVDDVRIAAQELTTPASHPSLHLFRSDRSVNEMNPEAAVQGFITVATALAPAIRTIIAHHLVVRSAGPLIIEGDGLLPAFAANQKYSHLTLFHGLVPSTEVRMAVIHEADETHLFKNFRTRGRGFEVLTGPEQAALVLASWCYGEWLRKEAILHRVPVIAARPYKTLMERVLSAIT